ncbi:MAG: hypothetical protein ACPLXC_03140 [Candidatus Pacearchaeota archaeon]
METEKAKDEDAPQTQVISDPKPKAPINWTRVGIIALIVAVIALIIVLVIIFAKQGPTTTKEMLNLTYSLETENGTAISSGTSEFEKGTVASSFNLASDKLDSELETMAIGESKTITLDAKDAYGEYDSTKTFTYERITRENRSMEMNRTSWLAIQDFTDAFNEQPELNKTYEITDYPWPFKVLEKNETHVKLSQEATKSQEIPFGFFKYKVESVTEDKITLKLYGNDTVIPAPNGNFEVKFTETEIITTITPTIGQEVELGNFPKARVTEMNATHLFLDANAPYAGQKIIAKITVNDIKKVKTKGMTGAVVKVPNAPTLQVFIMSYCPYGLQALKGLLPVWEKFQGKANVELRFVSYTMHGEKEDTENSRMICIRQEQSAKLIQYLKCFVEAGDAPSCIKKAGIDESKLNSCMSGKASQYMEEDKALNEQYGVQGSPTFILDGKEANIYPRDSQTIATAICNAFTGPKPSVCSESFSTENPSPGFGGGSSSSGSGGSCG